MNAHVQPEASTAKLETFSPERYTSASFLGRENEKLWPNVWQIVCREEQVVSGSFFTYNIANQSIIVVRKPDGTLVAHHNVCPHRGRRLVDGCGKAGRFRCSYHGWTFDMDGKNVLIQDRQDWGETLDGEQIDLLPVRVDTWGGFIFIDMREDGETLAEFLDPIPARLGAFEYEKMRYRYAYRIHIACNWKVAIEAFIEGYHVAGTHPQLLPIFGDDYTRSYSAGRHAYFAYENPSVPLAMPSPRIKMEHPSDPRLAVMEFFEVYERDMKAMFTERDYRASKNLLDVVPEGTDALTAFGAAVELGRAAAAAEGVPYPEAVTWDYLAAAGADWHLFPNFATLPWFDGALCYRALPDPKDPDKCYFDIWSLVRYAPGKEPEPERRTILDPAQEGVLAIADQDIANMAAVQEGMKSMACRKLRPNPVQEVPIINFHKVLDTYLDLKD